MLHESIILGIELSAGSFILRRLVAGLIYKKDANNLVSRTQRGGSKFEFLNGTLKRESNQDLLKGIIPVVIGFVGIGTGIYEAFTNNLAPAITLLTVGILHLTEGQVYMKNRRKQFRK